MERVEQLLRDGTIRQRLWAIACMGRVLVEGELILQHFAGYAIAPTRSEAERTARHLAVKQLPRAEQWDAWVQEVPDQVILLAARHIQQSE